MDLLCNNFLTVTWYPGQSAPTESGGVVLTDASAGTDFFDATRPWRAGHAQLVQSARYVRGAQARQFVRGQNAGAFDWVLFRKQADPRDALVAGLTHVLALSDETGWLQLTIDGETTEYSIDQVAMESAEAEPLADGSGLIQLTWRFRGGAWDTITPP